VGLSKTFIASYLSQAYVTLIGLVLMPVYLSYMGAENYGLVGFFLMMQGWFQLLDIGMTPTISREAARFNSGVGSASELRQLVRFLQVVFFSVAVSATVLFSTAADSIASEWLTFHELERSEVVLALHLIGGLVSLRWACGLFRGIVIGFEKLIWLALFNVGIATMRFVLVVPVLAFVGSSATEFFVYQIGVSVFELGLLIWKSHRLLPRSIEAAPRRRNWVHLRVVSRFSLTIALTGAISIVVTQVDKLALSKLITLNEFGYFTAAVLVASGVTMIIAPIGTVLQPRLTNLSASREEGHLFAVYRAATQLFVLLAIPAVLVMAAFPEQLLWAWTGDRDLSGIAAPTLALYAVGNGLMALGALPYYLLFARGNLRLHLIGSVLFAAAFVPLCIWGAVVRGPVGAGLALILVAAAYLLLWVPRIHREFAQGLHRRWIVEDIAPIVLPAAVGAVLCRLFLSMSADRLLLGLQLAAVAAFCLLLAGSGSNWARAKVLNAVRRVLARNRSA
jgi:O-antigen/teichoic acid export membrane protein